MTPQTSRPRVSSGSADGLPIAQAYATRADTAFTAVIPEWFGGGTLQRKELHELAEQLTASHAGLIAVGEPTIEKALDQALTSADKVVKRTVDATTDEIASELQEALKG
jgi:hypothetical protein